MFTTHIRLGWKRLAMKKSLACNITAAKKFYSSGFLGFRSKMQRLNNANKVPPSSSHPSKCSSFCFTAAILKSPYELLTNILTPRILYRKGGHEILAFALEVKAHL